MEEFEGKTKNVLSEDELSNVSGGIGVRMNNKGNPLFKSSESSAVHLKYTNTVCPRCHCYRKMAVSEDAILTCSCGYSWQVYL